jgi:hypothetical protein
MSIALVIQHAKAHAPYYIFMRGQSGCTRCSHIISSMTRLSEKKLFMNIKFLFWFCYNIYVKRFSFQEELRDISLSLRIYSTS